MKTIKLTGNFKTPEPEDPKEEATKFLRSIAQLAAIALNQVSGDKWGDALETIGDIEDDLKKAEDIIENLVE